MCSSVIILQQGEQLAVVSILALFLYPYMSPLMSDRKRSSLFIGDEQRELLVLEFDVFLFWVQAFMSSSRTTLGCPCPVPISGNPSISTIQILFFMLFWIPIFENLKRVSVKFFLFPPIVLDSCYCIQGSCSLRHRLLPLVGFISSRRSSFEDIITLGLT